MKNRARFFAGTDPATFGDENNYFTEMCSGFEAGSYLRLIHFVYQSTPVLRVIKKKKKSLALFGCFRGYQIRCSHTADFVGIS